MSKQKGKRKAIPEKKSPLRHLVILWYLPIVVILGSGLFVSLQGSKAAQIVDQARVFQDTHEASQAMDELYSLDFSLSIGLDEKFKLTGENVATQGDLRARDKLAFPIQIASPTSNKISSAHLEFKTKDGKGFIRGISVGVKTCPKGVEKTGTTYHCIETSETNIGSLPLDGSTYAVMKKDELLDKEGKTILVELSLGDDAILPLEGYTTDFTARVLGLENEES